MGFFQRFSYFREGSVGCRSVVEFLNLSTGKLIDE